MSASRDTGGNGPTPLSKIPVGNSWVVASYDQGMPHDTATRLRDLGFWEGQPVTCLRRGFGGTAVYAVSSAEVFLRAKQAESVLMVQS